MSGKALQSIIAADIGSTFTHACLIDQVAGISRLVAVAESPTTASELDGDVSIGLARAIKQLEYAVQRPLLDDHDELITPERASGAGVDALVATSSAARPPRCVIIGLTDDLSVESATQACLASNVLVAKTVPLGARMRRWNEQTISELHSDPPDLILIVGGVDAGPVAPLQGAAQMLGTIYQQMESSQRPRILFAGNQEARRPLLEILSPLFTVSVVNNVRPSIDKESTGELQRELLELYERVQLPRVPGMAQLAERCASPIAATSTALSALWRFMAQRNEFEQGILGVDVGGATTHISLVHDDTCEIAIAPSVGASYGIQRVLQLSGAGNIRRWLPGDSDADALLDRLENAYLRPHSIPQALEDHLLVHALARQAILQALHPLRRQQRRAAAPHSEHTALRFDWVAARGGAFAHAPQDALTAWTLLDSVQPTGLTRLVVDWASIWPQLGAIAKLAPLAAVQVLARDALKELGTVIAPLGEAHDGDKALEVRIQYEDGRVAETDILAGALERFPLPAGEQAIIEVRPSRYFDIGLGRKGQGGRATVHGGALGILIDARGRPLNLPQDTRLRRFKTQQWFDSLIDDAGRPI